MIPLPFGMPIFAPTRTPGAGVLNVNAAAKNRRRAAAKRAKAARKRNR